MINKKIIFRCLRFYKNLLFGNVLKINLAVTDMCNMKCKVCYIWKKPKNDLSLNDFRAIFRKFKGLNWISFTGGEPFLRDDLVDIIDIAMKECSNLHTISIPTNGFFTKKIMKDVKRVLKSDIPSLYVSISLDGLENVHDSVRGVKGSFKKAVNTFELLKNLGDRRLKVHFEYTISRFNEGRLPETVKALGKPEDFIISIAQNSFYYANEGEKVKPSKKSLHSDIEWFLSNHKGRSIHDFATRMFLKSILEGKKIPCVAGKNSFYIDTKGEIHPCIFINKRLGKVNEDIREFNYPGCRCYTPCESYLSLLLNAPKMVLSR